MVNRSAIREESVEVGELLERLWEAELWNESVLIDSRDGIGSLRNVAAIKGIQS